MTLDDLEGLYGNRNCISCSTSSQATAGLCCSFYDVSRQTQCLIKIRQKRSNRGN